MNKRESTTNGSVTLFTWVGLKGKDFTPNRTRHDD